MPRREYSPTLSEKRRSSVLTRKHQARSLSGKSDGCFVEEETIDNFLNTAGLRLQHERGISDCSGMQRGTNGFRDRAATRSYVVERTTDGLDPAKASQCSAGKVRLALSRWQNQVTSTTKEVH